jgi:hypothetical protein
MTPEQRSLCLDLKPHIDRVNRTGTLNIPMEYWAKIQDVAREIEGKPIDSCRDCMIEGIKRLYRIALNG